MNIIQKLRDEQKQAMGEIIRALTPSANIVANRNNPASLCDCCGSATQGSAHLCTNCQRVLIDYLLRRIFTLEGEVRDFAEWIDAQTLRFPIGACFDATISAFKTRAAQARAVAEESK